MCLTEVTGSSKLLPACVTKVAEGMEVQTNTERLRKYRLMILELLFAERNHICAVCVANNHCDLQNLAKDQGMMHVRFPISTQTPPWMLLTRCLCSITTAASYARAACGSATRSRVLTRGMSWAAAPIRGSSPISTSLGDRQTRAQAAASAFMFAQPGRVKQG
jgi:NADH dehydrogenase/NADH:ubiquinone oxidoreductase 75 kD subunit (chain G)